MAVCDSEAEADGRKIFAAAPGSDANFRPGLLAGSLDELECAGELPREGHWCVAKDFRRLDGGF
ncbi:hypothetical protein GCM10009792_22410 [Microcella alkalica]